MVDAIARTQTFKLALPPFNRRAYNDPLNQNFQIIDAILTRYAEVNNFQGAWQNSTQYTVGQRTLDVEQAQIYTCLVTHVTPAAPTTFAQSRIANPSYWELFSNVPTFAGPWVAETDYVPNTFVVNGYKYAICTSSHTASNDFDADVLAGLWTILVDATSIITAASDEADRAESEADLSSAFADLAEAFAQELVSPPTGGSAKGWAQTNKDVDVPGTTGGRSAKHYSEKAAEYAASVNLPPIQTGDQGKVLTVNSAETAYELKKASSLPVPINTNTTLDAGLAYRITGSSSLTLTLPSAPSNGDTIWIVDGESISNTVQHTIARNGQTIMGLAEDLLLNIKGISLQIWFNGTTWRLF